MNKRMILPLVCLLMVLGAAGCQQKGAGLEIAPKAGDAQRLLDQSSDADSEVIARLPGGGEIVTGQEAVKDDGRHETLEAVDSAEDKTGAVAIQYYY